MKNFERRLADDAAKLETLRLSAQREAALAEALQHTRQQRPGNTPRRDDHRGWWLPGLVAASLTLAFLLYERHAGDTAPTAVISATPAPSTSNTPVLRPLGEFATFEQVSQAEALDQEWVNLQKDLAQARETIQSDLPVRF